MTASVVVVTASSPPPQAADARPDGDAQWDAGEVWVFDARPQLRIVDVTGAAPVDPNHDLASFQLEILLAYLQVYIIIIWSSGLRILSD